MCSKIPETDLVGLYGDFMAACAQSPEVLDRWGEGLSGPEQDFVAARLRPGDVLLAGCGHGRGIGWLRKQDRLVVAVDRDEHMCALTRRAYPETQVQVVQTGLAELGTALAGRSFGTILCLGLVSGGLFLPGEDGQACLAGLASSLKADGVVLLDFLDAGPGPRGRVQRFDYPLGGGHQIPACCYWPTRTEIKAALWAVGLGCELVELDRDPDAPLVGVAARPRGDKSVMEQ